MKKFIVIACLTVAPTFALIACSSPEKKMEKIRQSLKSHDYSSDGMNQMSGPMGGKLTINNQYPKITFSFQFNEIVKEDIPKDGLKGFDKQMTEEVCRQIPELDKIVSKAVGESDTKLFARVLQMDGVNFEFVFKDKMGRDIAVFNQKISSCPNFGTLLN
ncbi:hypothetical protein [Moraxella oblonga]|uniref:hypothetical protein n=1 Tax=Moraxella oblonga TaxID=200413 RepID=UPI00082F9EDE|nr:hypothetical protein [Moraxella oblonga]